MFSVTDSCQVIFYSGEMQSRRVVSSVPVKMLLFTPGVCAVVNLIFLLLPSAVGEVKISDVTQEIVSGVSIVLCWICLIAAMWRRWGGAGHVERLARVVEGGVPLQCRR